MTTWAIATGIIIVLLGIVIVLARQNGKQKAERDFFEESHENANKAREIDEEVARMSDPALDDELRHPK